MQAGEVAGVVLRKQTSARKRRLNPAALCEDWRAQDRTKTCGRRIADHQLAFFGETNELVPGKNQRAAFDAFFHPLDRAGRSLETNQVAAAGIPVDPKEMTGVRDGGVEVGAEPLIAPPLGQAAARDFIESRASAIATADQNAVAVHQWGRCIDVVLGSPRRAPELAAVAHIEPDQRFPLEEDGRSGSGDLRDHRRRVTGFVAAAFPDDLATRFVDRNGRFARAANIEQQQIAIDQRRSGKTPRWTLASEIALKVTV